MNATSTLRPLLGILVASTAALGAAACGGSGTDSDQVTPNNTAAQATITGYLTMSQPDTLQRTAIISFEWRSRSQQYRH